MISKKLSQEQFQQEIIRLYARALRYKRIAGHASLEEIKVIATLETLESYEEELDDLIVEADHSECPSAYDDEYWSLYDICSEIELELSEMIWCLCQPLSD